MQYKIMRMICMFDLPVVTEKEKKNYREFRKGLLEEGFIMLQYSIYIRTCPSRDYCDHLKKRLQKIIPPSGNIRLLVVTKKQYEDMVLLVGSKNSMEKIGTERMVVI